MPLIPVADDPGTRGVLGREPAPDPSGDVVAAAFRQENVIVSALQALRYSGQFSPVPGYSALPDIEGTPYFAEHSDRFTGSQSPAETQSIKMRIDQENADRRTLAAAGIPGMIASMVAGNADPTVALPIFSVARAGSTFARAAARTGAAVAVQTGIQESLLQATQQTRTPEESAANIATATLLGALIGGAAERLLTPVEHTKLVTDLDADRRALGAHVEGRPPLGEPPAVAAALTTDETARLSGLTDQLAPLVDQARQATAPAFDRSTVTMGEVRPVDQIPGYVRDVVKPANGKSMAERFVFALGAAPRMLVERIRALDPRIGEAIGQEITISNFVIDKLYRNVPTDADILLAKLPDLLADGEPLLDSKAPGRALITKPYETASGSKKNQVVVVEVARTGTSADIVSIHVATSNTLAKRRKDVGAGGSAAPSYGRSPEETPAAAGFPSVSAQENITGGGGTGNAVGAAVSDTRRLDLVPTGVGLEKVGFDPVMRTLNQPSVEARRGMADLVEVPLEVTENLRGGTTVLGGGPALETIMRVQGNQARVLVHDTLLDAWKAMRFEGGSAPWFARMRDRLGLLDRPDGLPTFEEFKSLVSDAMMAGDQHEIPQVATAAKAIRAATFDAWAPRAEAAIEGFSRMEPAEGEGFFPHAWNKQKIAADRPGFVNNLTELYVADQATKAAAKERVGALNNALQAVGNQLGRLQAKLDRLAASSGDVEVRLQERAMEVGRTERRTGALEERASSIAEEASEIEAFVAEMRRQVSDPAMRERLDAMERDARELRRVDRPMTEAQLRAIEDEELKGVLTGTTRMAAEMLTGRRKMPKAPSFLSWLVSNGGINDVGGDVRHISGGNRARPGLINQRGRGLDEIGEKLANEFPEAFPESAGHPTPDQILGWIDGAARGLEPDWWVERFSSAQRDEIAAGNLAAALDEALTRAGVEVRSVRDVARILRDERPGGVSLADLDRIAAEMETVGQDIPVSMRRAAVDEDVAATRQGIADLRALIARGRAGAEAKGRRLRLAEARGEEAGLAERANRGRLGVLEDRLSRAEQRREILEDVQVQAEQARAALRERIEEEIGAWQGKSAGEAKSELRAREKAEAERQAKAAAAASAPTGRLTSADAAVDRAVKRILESDRDLSVAELRDIAHQTTDRILGSPDGRLPYDLFSADKSPGGGEQLRGSLHGRELDVTNAFARPWIETDIEKVTANYLRTFMPDVLIAERFGDVEMSNVFAKINEDYAKLTDATRSQAETRKLEKQRNTAIEDLAAMRDRMRGVYNIPQTASARRLGRISAAVRNANIPLAMGSSTISSLPDSAGAIFRWGFGGAMRDGWMPFVSSLMTDQKYAKEAIRQARASGLTVETLTAARHHEFGGIADMSEPHSPFERALAWGADKFSLINLMAPWTDYMKTIASTAAAQGFMRAAEALGKGTATVHQLRSLGAGNITPALAERIVKQYREHQTVIDKVALPNTEAWTDRAAREAFEGALSRDANIAVVTPGVDKPLFLSDPVLAVLGQYKTFTAAATTRILVANMQRADAQTLQGLIATVGLGMVSYKLNAIAGGRPTSDNPSDWIKEGISRGGLLGWFEEGNALARKASGGSLDVYRLLGSKQELSRFAGRSALDQVLGPTAGKVEGLLKVTTAIGRGDWKASDTHALRQLIVTQNLFYARRLWDQFETGFNGAFGIPMRAQ